MRPMNHAALALLQAANKLSAAGRSVTLASMAAEALVSPQTARLFVPSLKKRGHLRIVGLQRVAYRNRPVALYAPVQPEAETCGCDALVACMAGWAR